MWELFNLDNLEFLISFAIVFVYFFPFNFSLFIYLTIPFSILNKISIGKWLKSGINTKVSKKKNQTNYFITFTYL